eukprot:574077-Pelagomonas_calceolata.AAC.11
MKQAVGSGNARNAVVVTRIIHTAASLQSQGHACPVCTSLLFLHAIYEAHVRMIPGSWIMTVLIRKCGAPRVGTSCITQSKDLAPKSRNIQHPMKVMHGIKAHYDLCSPAPNAAQLRASQCVMPVSILQPNFVLDNVAAGSERMGFQIKGPSCDTASDLFR